MLCRAGQEAGRLLSPLPTCWGKTISQPVPTRISSADAVILQFACICVLLKACSFGCPQELFRPGRETLSLIAFCRQPRTADFIWEIAWDEE